MLVLFGCDYRFADHYDFGRYAEYFDHWCPDYSNHIPDPVSAFLKFRNIHRQNLAQTAISSATFGAANSLMLPVAISFILGRVDLVWPMLIGATLGMSIDMCMLYWLFDSKAFPGKAAWPAGIAAAEAIKAGDKGGKQAMLLVWGILGGIVGSFSRFPCRHWAS